MLFRSSQNTAWGGGSQEQDTAGPGFGPGLESLILFLQEGNALLELLLVGRAVGGALAEQSSQTQKGRSSSSVFYLENCTGLRAALVLISRGETTVPPHRQPAHLSPPEAEVGHKDRPPPIPPLRRKAETTPLDQVIYKEMCAHLQAAPKHPGPASQARSPPITTKHSLTQVRG